MTSNIEKQFAEMKRQQEYQDALMHASQLQNLLCHAMCAVCSEALDGEEMELNESELLCHARCIADEEHND